MDKASLTHACLGLYTYIHGGMGPSTIRSGAYVCLSGRKHKVGVSFDLSNTKL
jgi:hypothetical protein